jgi:hypothetical protein
MAGCSNIDMASRELMNVDRTYLTYEWRYAGAVHMPLEDAMESCGVAVENDAADRISKQQAVARLEACLNSKGWHREVVEIILQD